MTHLRRRAFAVGATVATAAAAVVVATTTVPSGASAPQRDATTATRYALVEPACPRPTSPDEVTCFALRRVYVPKRTVGAQAVTATPSPDALHGPAGGLTPHALVTAYGLRPNHGRGQTVAVIDWYDDPHALSDLRHFDAHYGIAKETRKTFVKVNQNGRRRNYPARSRNLSTEISLDVQAVRAVCRKCKIMLVEAKNNHLANLARAVNTAVRLGADEISNSYGAPEQRGHPVPKAEVNAYHHPRKVITASTGDHGRYGWDYENGGAHPDQGLLYPASNPGVVAVGGTKLVLRASGRRAKEPVWNENGPGDRRGWPRRTPSGASGGGCSFQFAATTYQHQRAAYRKAGCHGHRLAADMSAVADPYTGLDIYNTFSSGDNGWQTIGGTSLSAPLVAAMWALAGGAHGMRHPVQALYQNSRFDPRTIRDISAGGTGFCGGVKPATCESIVHKLAANTNRQGTNNPNYFFGNRYADCSFGSMHKTVHQRYRNRECNAMDGYDGPSGVGTPRNGVRMFRSTTPHAKITFRGTLYRNQRKTFSARLHDPIPGAHGKTWVWTWGDNSAATRTHVYQARHTYHSFGSHRVTVRIFDTHGQRIVVKRVVTAHHRH